MAEIRINSTGELKLYDSDDSNYVSFKSAGTVSSNVAWVLPSADGSSGQVLSTNGSGTLSWATASSADPSSADGDSLGTASAEWSDLFLADGGIVYFGNDQDIRLTHNADKGLIIKHSATADDKPVILTLQTGETDMAANDVIGKIEFQAPDEGTGTDAVLVSGAIQAVAEGNHSSSSNATRLEFMTGASEAAATKMWLTSGGKLGLGTAPDLGTLHVRTADSSGGVSGDADELVLENSGHAGVTIASGNSSNGNIYFSDSGNSAIGYIQYGHDNNDLVFATNDAERMIILNDGHIAINGTSKLGTYSTGILSVTADIGNTDQGITIKNTNAAYNAEHMFMEFLNSSGARAGCISHTAATTTAYTTSSDYRLKENETNITDGINRLKQLKPYKFNFKADKDTTVDGFFAHEVSSIVPEAIIGKKDAVNKDNNPIYQGIDQSKLVPLLTSALQEAITKIETLETKVAALEG